VDPCLRCFIKTNSHAPRAPPCNHRLAPASPIKMSENGSLENGTHVSEIQGSTGFVTTEGWSLDALLQQGHNFQPVPVVDIAQMSSSQIEDLVKSHEESGLPLLMRNWHKTSIWKKEIFDPEWLERLEGSSSKI
jgi:hypothetical protein